MPFKPAGMFAEVGTARAYWGANYLRKYPKMKSHSLLALISLLASPSAFANTLYPVGGKLINRHTRDFITLGCTEEVKSILDCPALVFAEGNLITQQPLTALAPNAQFKIEQMSAMQHEVRDEMGHKMYLKFSWFPLTDAMQDEFHKDIESENPLAQLFMVLFVEMPMTLVTASVDVAMVPVNVPRELGTIAVQHLTFPLKSRRFARLTGDLEESGFSRKVSDGNYHHLKDALLGIFGAPTQ